MLSSTRSAILHRHAVNSGKATCRVPLKIVQNRSSEEEEQNRWPEEGNSVKGGRSRQLNVPVGSSGGSSEIMLYTGRIRHLPRRLLQTKRNADHSQAIDSHTRHRYRCRSEPRWVLYPSRPLFVAFRAWPRCCSSSTVTNEVPPRDVHKPRHCGLA